MLVINPVGRREVEIMDRIKRIRGNSAYTFFEMVNGDIVDWV